MTEWTHLRILCYLLLVVNFVGFGWIIDRLMKIQQKLPKDD